MVFKKGRFGFMGKSSLRQGFVNGVETETSAFEKGIDFETEHKSTRSEGGSFSSVWDRPKCWTRAKGSA